MNNQEYEQKKRECWEEFTTMPLYKAFNFAFDRAYALGKKEIKQEIKQETDAEDILCVSREKEKEAFDTAKKIAMSKMSSKMSPGAADMVCKTLDILFDSKCLLDEEQIAENANCSNVDSPEANVDSLDGNVDSSEPKQAELKFTKGDMVHCKSFGYEGDYKVLEYTGGPRSCYDCIDKYGAYYRFYESDLEPYTAPTAKNPKESAKAFASDEPTATGSDDFDHIVNDGFRGHNRLHIATQIAASIYSNDKAASRFNSIEALVRKALDIADTLIAEVEKGAER